MYKPEKLKNRRSISILAISTLCFSSLTYAETLGQRAIYTVNIIVQGDPTEMGVCSAFLFGDITGAGGSCATGGFSAFKDREVLTPPALSGGDGVAGDGFAGVLSIQTGLADAAGNNTFTVLSYQMDPYEQTAGGDFKTTMTPPDGANTGTGTVDALGNITLDLTGRVGVAESFELSLGILPWNIDDSMLVPGTNLQQLFTTETSTNFNPVSPGEDPAGAPPLVTLTGRPVGDANGDLILDAVLVSAGNVGALWGLFDGTPYTEAFNVQFVVVSADPVAVDDRIGTAPNTPIVINVANDLINSNDTHAAGEALTLDSFTQPLVAGSTLVDNGDGTLTYTPEASLIGVDQDSFTYTVADAGGETDTATVNVDVKTGAPVTAVDDAFSTNEDTAITFDPVNGSEPGVMVDTDPDPDTLVLFDFDQVSANAGTVIAAVGDSLTYTPAPNFFGVDTFDYVVHDGNGNLDTGTVTLTVATVNDAPVCIDGNLTAVTNTALDISVIDQVISTATAPILCTDVEADVVTLDTFDPVTTEGGTVTLAGDTLTYTPKAGFIGLDTFTVTATDGVDQAAPHTITVNVADPKLGNFTMLNTAGNTFGGTNDVVFDWDRTTFNTSVTDPVTAATAVATMRSKGDPVNEPDGHEFFGDPWFAHHIRMFGPGTYTFDTTCSVAQIESIGTEKCDGPLTMNGTFVQTQQFVTIEVGPDQVLAHILFDYTITKNIDVFNLYNKNEAWDRLGGTGVKNKLFPGPAGFAPDESTDWELVNIDGDGDGIVGIAMVDGSFPGFSANFNIGPGGTAPPPEPIDTEVSRPSLSSLSLWSLVLSLFSITSLRLFRSNK